MLPVYAIFSLIFISTAQGTDHGTANSHTSAKEMPRNDPYPDYDSIRAQKTPEFVELSAVVKKKKLHDLYNYDDSNSAEEVTEFSVDGTEDVEMIRNDLGNTSEKSELDIYNITEEVSKNISIIISNLNSEVIDHVLSQERNISDLNDLHRRIKEIYDSFSSIKEMKSLKTFSQNIRAILDKLNITISTELLESLSQYDYSLTFLKKFGKVYDGSSDWMDVFRSLLKNLDSSYAWYSCLKNLLTYTSKYKVQKDLNRYSILVENPTRGLEGLKGSKILLKFLKNELKTVPIEEEYGRIDEGVLDEIKLEHLESVLNFTLKKHTKFLYDDSDKILRIEGNFIKVSDVPEYQAALDGLKSIQIFSSNKIFIDSDLDATGVPHVSIIAPIWEIVGENRTINLDGIIGDTYPVADTPEKSGVKGIDGKAGRPGNSAGHFLGIGETFLGSQLQIHSVGGQGGPGQEGSAGGRGEGRLFPDGNINGELKWPEGYSYRCESPNETRYDASKDVDYETECKVETYCTAGGDGGDGGIGGIGGKSGQIITISLKNNPEIVKVQTPGENGVPGEGGTGGLAGESGQRMNVSCWWWTTIKSDKNVEHAPENWTCVRDFDTIEYTTCSSGKEGHSGESKQGLPLQEPTEIPLPNIAKIVNWYKDFAREKISSCIESSFLKQFMLDVENHPQVKNSHELLG